MPNEINNMSCREKFEYFREKYPNFIYHSYDVSYDNENLNIIYNFEIEGLKTFKPEIHINQKYILNKNINEKTLNNLIFNIGLIELISYVKPTCSRNIFINAGYISDSQIDWLKKLYYNGLGEFRYVNGIDISIDDLFNIVCNQEYEDIKDMNYIGNGNLIAVGGGKDSCVALEILRNENNNACFVINPKDIHINCCNAAGYNDEEIIGVKRVLDPNMVKLKDEGYLNGHTPFSAIVAFISYLTCYLQGKKNIILSNESSANEATVLGTNINHQYSKSYEFEKDFYEYTHKYLGLNINYFSLLRPLSEFQIGALFSNYTKYHKVFKSCNLGSKNENWKWCCNCPKCLFVFTILSPFLYKDKLLDIFGEDLFEREDMLNTFKEILGYSSVKPFECVGTYEEARYAVSLLIEKLDKNNLPVLLQYYYDNYSLELDGSKILSYNNENNLDEYFEKILKEELDKLCIN